MAALSTNTVPVNGGLGIEDTAIPATLAGDTAECGPGIFLAVVNGDASPHTVTIATPGTVSGLAVTDATLVVGAGETGIIPLPRVFAGATGRAAITYDAVTSVEVGVFRLGS
jgi:hypothetical protein